LEVRQSESGAIVHVDREQSDTRAHLIAIQMNGHRPTPDLAQYTVPGAEGLYVVGPFMHPGAGLTGAGRTTATRMLTDLDIDFGQGIGVEQPVAVAREER
jgi:hypothetical protein